MHQKEMFPEKKIFSHGAIIFWLTALTISFLLLTMVLLINFLIISTKNVDQNEISQKIDILEAQVKDLENKLSNNNEDTENLKGNSEEEKEDEVNNSEEISDTNESKLDSGDWESYSSVNYGFSVKYPNNWTLEKAGSSVPSKIIEDANASMITLVSPTDSKILIIPEGHYETKIEAKEVSNKEVRIAEKNAQRIEYDNGYIIYNFKDSHNFRIEFDPYNKKDQQFLNELLNN